MTRFRNRPAFGLPAFGLMSIAMVAFLPVARAISGDPPSAPPAAAIELLPPERGGQQLVGRDMPALTFDRWVRPPASLATPEASDSKGANDVPAVTLYRWWTNGCPYCERSLPSIERWRDEYGGRGLRTVAVYHPKPPRPPSSVSDAFIIQAAETLGYQGAIALDSDWSQLEAASADWNDRRATSITILVDHNGLIRFVHPDLDYFPSSASEHQRQNRDHELLEQAIKSLLNERESQIAAGHNEPAEPRPAP